MRKINVFNQKYWGQFSRKKWLLVVDSSSQLFHQIAMNQCRCIIHRLKNELDLWIDEANVIRKKFIMDFTVIFRLARNFLPLMSNLDISSIRPVSSNERVNTGGCLSILQVRINQIDLEHHFLGYFSSCLLYTSDAADE